MNLIAEFFTRHIVEVFFFYGLAFFTMGLALVLSGRRTSELRFARAVLPLAAFGFIHAIHEWIEMFQRINVAAGGAPPGFGEEIVRLAILVASFVMLAAFGVTLLAPEQLRGWRVYLPVMGLFGLWVVVTVLVLAVVRPTQDQALLIAEGLARYTLAIPGALLGAIAFVVQQRSFREHGMPEFGRDLLWCALALFLYGVVGQVFVRAVALWPFSELNGAQFILWFGIPVQLFRAVMAGVLTYFLLRALRAFELENQRRLDRANAARLEAQTAALETERRTSREMERFNEELRLATYKLSLLLDLSNLLNVPQPMPERLRRVLGQIVNTLDFANAGLILLAERDGKECVVAAAIGLPASAGSDNLPAPFDQGFDLGCHAIAEGVAICLHVDGQVLVFTLEEALLRRECQQYMSPTTVIALPLPGQRQVTETQRAMVGSIVLLQGEGQAYPLSSADLSLIVGVAQQLGLSLENALLHEEAQQREKMLGELLRQVVGAQEAERQRIARELHDATGQSLTAVALGLRGVEKRLQQDEACEETEPIAGQIKELQSFSTNAIGELHRIISDLRPPQLDDLGLVAALRWYVKAYEQRRGIVVVFKVEGGETALLPEYKTVLFRIAQESLTNVAKHAEATQVQVDLSIRPTNVQLVIQDNGRGFDLQAVLPEVSGQEGWGLVGIRERALLLGGQLKIDTAPGRGTRIQVDAPVANSTAVAPIQGR